MRSELLGPVVVFVALSLACGGTKGPAELVTERDIEVAAKVTLPGDASDLRLAAMTGIDPIAQASFRTSQAEEWAAEQGFALRPAERFDTLPSGLEDWWVAKPSAGSLYGEKTDEGGKHREDWMVRVDPGEPATVWVHYVRPY